ncbi:hypothetical protein B7494_g7555 [Chlorociboria aeruginascens]|nr:hypothetical protein B7494_g7555 [Chlorociboria aeruginascens]
MDDVPDLLPDVLNNSTVDTSSVIDNPLPNLLNDSTVGPSTHAARQRPKHSTAEDEFFSNPINSTISNLKDVSILLNSKRRAVRNATTTVGAAWQDLDESGTYNPHVRASRRPRSRQLNGSRLKVRDEDGSPVPEKPRPTKGYEFSLPVTLSLKSAKGRVYLKSITSGPEDKEHRFSRQYSQFLLRTQGSENEDDGLTLDQLTDGYPQRRGCKACFESGDDTCTLIDHGFEYPCTACRDCALECELIIPPTLKRVKMLILVKPVKKRKRTDQGHLANFLHQQHLGSMLPVKNAERMVDGVHSNGIKMGHAIAVAKLIKNGTIRVCNPFFGLFGHGALQVRVLPDPSGRNGYEELSGGHCEKGEDYTRMCIACTSSRIMIAVCETHIIGELKVQDIRVFHDKTLIESVVARLNGDEVKAKLANEAKWCSICPRPAVYQCCTPQIQATMPVLPSFANNNSISEIGCGLLLCETCEDLLTKIQNSRYAGAQCASQSGNFTHLEVEEPILDVMLRLASEKSREDYYECGLRADSGFLSTKGELITRVSYEEVDVEKERNDDDEGWNTYGDKTSGRWGNFRGYMDSLVDQKVEKRMQKIEKDRSGRPSFDVPQTGAFAGRDLWRDHGNYQSRMIEDPLRHNAGGRQNIGIENGMGRSRGFGYVQREDNGKRGNMGMEREMGNSQRLGCLQREDIGMENKMGGGRRMEDVEAEKLGRQRDLEMQDGMHRSNKILGRGNRDIFSRDFDVEMEDGMGASGTESGIFEKHIDKREGQYGMGNRPGNGMGRGMEMRSRMTMERRP